MLEIRESESKPVVGASRGLRLSRYTICSTRTRGGAYVLLHGLTGAVDVVDEGVVSGLASYGTFFGAAGEPLVLDLPEKSTPLSIDEEAMLEDRGYLTRRTDNEEIRLAGDAAGILHDAAGLRPSFLILPTIDCNYRCTYCFERTVQKNLNRARAMAENAGGVVARHASGNVTMTSAHVDAIYDSIPELQVRHGDDRETVQIVLYGGEPLDARNEAVVRDIVRRGTERGHRFAAVTNGHDAQCFMDLFGMHAIQQVQISIDGPKHIHDARRIHLGRESSFDRAMAAVRSIVAQGDALVQIRVHVDPANLLEFRGLLDLFEDEGWLDHPDIIIYANTVYRTGKSDVGGMMELDEIDAALDEIVTPYENVLLNAPTINLRAKILPALMRGFQIPVQGTYCAANTGQYLFAPDGHLYSCWESVGKADSRIGRYLDASHQPDLNLDEAATSEWFGRHAGRIDACRKCPMALSCGGGCAQFAAYRSGTMRAPYCDSFDKIFRSSLASMLDVYSKRAEQGRTGRIPGGLVQSNYG